MTERRERSSKHRIRGWHIAAIVPCLLIVAFAVFRIIVRTKVNRRIDAIRAAGYPVTFAELDDWYRPPDGENAADYITTAFTHLHLPDKQQQERLPLFGSNTLPLRTYRTDGETRALIAQLLADNHDALELLREGAAIPGCRYPVDLAQGFSCRIPHLPPGLREATFLFVLESMLQAEEHNAEPAVQSILSAYGLAHSLRNEPTDISQIVRMSLHRFVGSGLERILNKIRLSDTQLRRIDAVLAAAHDPNASVLPLVYRRCSGYEAFRKPRDPDLVQETQEEAPSVAHIAIGRALGTLDLSLLEYLDRVEQHMKILQLAPAQRLEAATEAKARYEANPLPPGLNWLLDDLAQIIRIDVEDMARVHVARAAIAIERYRLADDRLPESIADVVPRFLEAVPEDPFDSESLRYGKRDGGYVVYSIGPDGTDDGGTERRPKRSGQKEDLPYDVTFIIER
ncbi:MAG TPA: hypothetical protein PLU87_15150 [Sedimentisphaerales bacterium]|nr:hypothetical protein [Sedimentisphaerales bacterium]HRS12487.1 hypothetical protein [Sedimentisphaerales bacterium]HRV49070.1 hypothetical protein [Sedimentisphaerales bacterium]